MKKHLSNLIYSKTIENQGSSFNLLGETPDKGYMVSYSGAERKVNVLEFNQMHVEQFIRANLSHLYELGAYIGTWVDTDVVYIDLSANIGSLDEALKFASDNGQLAIYDVQSGKSIYL
jgi:hypothetical protein